MDRFFRLLLVAGLVAILVLGAFAGGIIFDRQTNRIDGLMSVTTPGQSIADTVSEVEDLLLDQALKPPNETSATAGAIQGLLDSTGDKYANYFDPRHFKYFNEQSAGEFGGIGVTIGEKDGQAYVVTVMPNTPAAKAGIKTDDIFVSVDGVKRDKWTSDEIVKRVRGDAGTKVKVVMKRGSELKTFDLTRAKIEVPNIDSRMLQDGIGYIRLYSFNQRAADDMRRAIDSLEKKGAKAFVLDVRDNPGGLLDQAVDIASLFVANGVVVRVDERGKAEQSSRATGKVATNAPVALLVNGNSASASEILAGALQDYDRATLVGEKTFGKGSVQTVEKLSSGGGIKFTIAHYLTPKKRVIDGKGVTPEHVVKMKPELQYDAEFQKDKAKDLQLQKAIKVLQSDL